MQLCKFSIVCRCIATTVFLAHHNSTVAACCLPVRNTVLGVGSILPFSENEAPRCSRRVPAWWQHAGTRREHCRRSGYYSYINCRTVLWNTGLTLFQFQQTSKWAAETENERVCLCVTYRRTCNAWYSAVL